MARETLQKFVVIDVETSGNRPQDGDQIIEIGLAVIVDRQVITKMSSFVACERDVPPFISRLTGITNDDLKEAPPFEDLAPDLLRELDGACLVAHHIDFDLHFLNNALVEVGYEAFQGPVLDTVEMARVLFPTLDGYRLPSLAKTFNLMHEYPHRAGSDAEVTAHLLLLMMNKLETIPDMTLKQLETYAAWMYSGLHLCIYDAMNTSRHRHQKNDHSYDIYRGFALKKEEKAPEKERESLSFNAETFFGMDGALQRVSPSFEHRDGQVTMANQVQASFSGEHHLLVEAATGTGKTLAYLYPAVCKSREINAPIIIATETIALQQQIKDRDVPLLEKGLGIPIDASVLKGRSHYLCLQKFEHFLERQGPASYDDALTVLQLLIWLTETNTGDYEELNLPNGGYALWDVLKSDPDVCTYANCSYFTRCFYPRAKQRARLADIIITNHALLLTDHFQKTRTLPKFDYVIVDEAHHMEEAAGRHLGVSMSYQQFMRLFNRFGVQDSTGLFANLSAMLTNYPAIASPDWMNERKKELQVLHYEWNQLFIALKKNIVKDDKGNRRKNDIYRPEDVLSSDVRDEYERVQAVAKDLMHAWDSMLKSLKDVAFTSAEETLINHVNTLLRDLEEAHDTLSSLLTIEASNQVFWAESDAQKKPDRLRLYRRPIDIGEQLAEHFFADVKSVVLTSATLTVKASFKYTIDQLGLTDEKPDCLQIASPFSYEEQAELLVPEDFPDITDGEEHFTEEVARFLNLLAVEVRGRMLVLFTSHQMVKAAYQLLKSHMNHSQDALFAQGVNGDNRSKLVKRFRSHERSILLGTTTFWEGIDLPGEDVRALIIVRLPFSPPDDPVFTAKAKQIELSGKSPFSQLALPRAVLRFKQGFGRLIRTKYDRGLIFVLDKRLVRARYGNVFLRSLPALPLVFAPTDELIERAKAFYESF